MRDDLPTGIYRADGSMVPPHVEVGSESENMASRGIATGVRYKGFDEERISANGRVRVLADSLNVVFKAFYAAKRFGKLVLQFFNGWICHRSNVSSENCNRKRKTPSPRSARAGRGSGKGGAKKAIS